MLRPLALPPGLSVRQALARVLRLPAVASKRYLTSKVRPAPCSAPSALCALPSACPAQGMAVGAPRARGGRGRGRAATPMA